MSRTQMEQSDSISSQDPHLEEAKKTKSRKPANTAFRQQRLKAWQPILTPKTVLPLFFIVGIIFAPIGGLLLYASSQVQELAIDYTDCIAKAPNTTAKFNPDVGDRELEDVPSDKVTAHFDKAMTIQPKWGKANDSYTFPWSNHTKSDNDVCVLTFTLPNDLKPPVLFYYRLTNFYQNHRRYVKSFDFNQWKGDARSASQIKSGDCNPLDVDNSDYGKGRPYYPCGLIANSMFNDTFDSPLFRSTNTTYFMTNKGISWASERDLYKPSRYKREDVVPPPFWRDQYPADGYDSTDLPNLQTWEEFQVWMRTAGLPTFSKLALRNNTQSMESGTYRLTIYDRFDVKKYGGTKSILISTRTVMGGKNPFLGIAYVVVGGLCVLLGAIFTATHLIKPRKLGDHTYLSWNNEQPSTATATGRSVRHGDTA